MEIIEVKGLVESVNRAFEEFKHTNDERLKALEAKGTVDPLIEQKLAKLNEAIDKGQEALSQHVQAVEAKINRLGVEGKGDGLTAEEREYKQAFQSYLRKGTEAKAMTVGSDQDGGYLVTPDTNGRLVKRVYETSPMRQICSVQTISTDALEGLIDKEEAAASWTSETGTRSTSTTPKVQRWRIPVHEMYSQPSASQQFLDDARIDVEAWLADKTADKFVRTENTAFVTGSGVGRPRGFASYTTAATADSSRAWGTLEHVATGTQASFGTDPNGSDKLVELISKLNPVYLPGARFVFPRSVLASIRKLKANSTYIWLPSMTATEPSTLLGYPYTLLEDMVAITASTDTLSLAFGDFKAGYQIVDRQGTRVLRDPFTSKPYILFYTTRRVGGDVIDFNAIKFLKFSAS